MNKVYIIIPVHNRIEKTLKCLRSIYAQDYNGMHVIVVDDGSSDSTKNDINSAYPQVTILEGDGSLFWTGAVKLGIEHVLNVCNKEDWVLLANNDIEMRDDVISNLVSFSVGKKRRIIVNALSVDSFDQDTIIKSGTRVLSWVFNKTQHVYHGESLEKISPNTPISVDLLTGRCLLHPVEIFSKIGNYNADLFPHYGGDDEFTARAKISGYELYILPLAIVYLDNKNDKSQSKGVMDHFFGIRSSINLINKWRFTKAVVPIFSRPSYYLIAVLKTFYILLK